MNDTIQDLVLDYINSDMDYTDKEDTRIIRKYREADQRTKDVVDDIFISICGYSMMTLIDEAVGSRTSERTRRDELEGR